MNGIHLLGLCIALALCIDEGVESRKVKSSPITRSLFNLKRKMVQRTAGFEFSKNSKKSEPELDLLSRKIFNTLMKRESCAANQFECLSDKRCVPKTYVCDGDADCSDGSDEDCDDVPNCDRSHPPESRPWTTTVASKTTTEPEETGGCNSEQFRCKDGRCIFGGFRCDGDVDCGDSTDEINCEDCRWGRFHCDNRKCVRDRFKCDGNDDCGDSSDERGCAPPPTTTTTVRPSRCSADQFRCDKGRCIGAAFKCDGDDDCGDSSDERGCDNGSGDGDDDDEDEAEDGSGSGTRRNVWRKTKSA